MAAHTVNIARNVIQNLVDMVPPERQQAAQALQGLFLNALENPSERSNAAKVSILVGTYGYVIANGYAEAAKLIGVKATTLQSRLSAGGGSFTFSRQDPESGAQMEVTATRGVAGTHNPQAQEILANAGGPWKRRSTATTQVHEPVQHDASGRVTTNRMKRFNPVENS